MTRTSEGRGGPDSLGCAVGFALLMLLGVMFVILLYVLWEKAMGT